MSKILLKLIRLYQATLSPDSGWFKIYYPHGFCRYHPHCSEYGYRAIEKYGVVKGILKTIWRLVRCNPLSSGGHDPLK
ncbi:membrane protein insertion efficiency factor YidD [bacterium]|nr:membrane protein insertion efficiency factor YidD [bacterium]